MIINYDVKEYLSALGIALTFVAYLPYIYFIIKNKTKPHVFSWGIWGVTTIIVFLAQLSDKGGAGSWVIGVSGTLVTSIAVLAYVKKSDVTIKKIDWYFLFGAITALCFWYFSSNPLWAVVILTGMNVIGFGPTLIKAYANPFEENLNFFVILIPRNLISIAALEHYSLTTVLFPIITAMACLVLVGLVIYKRLEINKLKQY